MNNIKNLIKILKECFISKGILNEDELLMEITKCFLISLPEEKIDKTWGSEKDNDFKMSPDMARKVLSGTPIPSKYKKGCIFIDYNIFSKELDKRLMRFFSSDRIEHYFKKILSSESNFLNDKKRVKDIQEYVVTNKSLFLADLIVDAILYGNDKFVREEIGNTIENLEILTEKYNLKDSQKLLQEKYRQKLEEYVNKYNDEENYIRSKINQYRQILEQLSPEDIYFLNNYINYHFLFGITLVVQIEGAHKEASYSKDNYSYIQKYDFPANRKPKYKIISRSPEQLIRLGLLEEIIFSIDRESSIDDILKLEHNRLRVAYNSPLNLSIEERLQKGYLSIFVQDRSCLRSLRRQVNEVNRILKITKAKVTTLSLETSILGLTSLGYGFLEYLSQDKLHHRRIMNRLYRTILY